MAILQEKLPAISIIILNYKTNALTLHLISLLKKDELFEIIVVDNNPDDSLAKEIKNQSFYVHYLRSGKNLGFSGGNNLGIKQSRGKWVLLLNSDTEITIEAIKKLFAITTRHQYKISVPKLMNKQGFVENNIGFFDRPTENFINWLFLRPRFINCSKIEKEQKCDVATGAVLLIHKSVFDSVGYFDDANYFMYFEDIDYSYRLYKKNIHVLYIPQVTVMHHGGASLKTENQTKKRYYQQSLRNFLLKNRGLLVAKLNDRMKFLA